MASSLVKLRKIVKTYGAIKVLDGIDLDIGNDEFVVVLGPSGSGKTTILRMIGGFTQPSSGEIEFDGMSLNGVPINKRPFNTVFQDYALFPHMTVADNVGFGLRVRGVASAQITAEAANALSLVELKGFADRYPAQLSGGQRQRVALARAIICKPRLILLDEPLAALDASLRRQMQTFLKDLQREIKTSFLFITHDQEEAITMADRIVIVDRGVICQTATPRQMYYQPDNLLVATFFGDNNLIRGTAAEVSEKWVVVETPFGTCRVQAPETLWATVKDPLCIAVRPENVTLVAADAAPLKGRVVSVEFTGPISVIKVESHSDPAAVLNVKCLSAAKGMELAIGGDVGISWQSEDAWPLHP
ncbi:ABC transporter ATP-binding protein [Mesorhizobium sp. B2-4-15]|uniref:ABC transporter ATP-binding protein n=1 Tax=Mesorhizobium sp. B2-4-15 TaxID=2589934 RepID=UPI001FED5A2A|nr:ABC transporter ATP-binding protein [Mesorhizobium sp. B2-4-15]